MKIRHAAKADVGRIYKFGTATSAFRVSSKIKFYEKTELTEWVKDKKDNIVVICEDGRNIIGFAYCKIMSNHWAMLDNFYVDPKSRKHGAGSKLQEFIESELLKRKIKYLTLLVEPGNKARGYLKNHGFSEQGKYVWTDKFL